MATPTSTTPRVLEKNDDGVDPCSWLDGALPVAMSAAAVIALSVFRDSCSAISMAASASSTLASVEIATHISVSSSSSSSKQWCSELLSDDTAPSNIRMPSSSVGTGKGRAPCDIACDFLGLPLPLALSPFRFFGNTSKRNFLLGFLVSNFIAGSKEKDFATSKVWMINASPLRNAS